MDIRKLTGGLSVSPQIATADIPAIAQAGFRAIICNRPDGEGADQPPFAQIANAARREGLAAHYLPIVSGQLGESDVVDFARQLAELPGPVLAYCRSGTRSTTLWALSEVGKRSLPAILETAKAAGYDMTAALSQIKEDRFAPAQDPRTPRA